MNNNRNNRRRGRGNRNQGGNGNQLNRIDSRARGNAPQLLEKYKKLAQDAQHNGDRVQMEYYLQFADHYFRVIADNKARQDEQRGPRRNDERDQQDDSGDDEGDFDRGRRADRGPRQRRDDRDDRDDPRGTEEGDYGQEGEPFLSDDGSDEQSEPEREARPEPRRSRQARKPRENAQAERPAKSERPAKEDRAEKRADKSEPRRRKPRKASGDENGGIDSSVLPPSIRGDDSDDSSGDSDGTLQAVG